MIFIYPAMNAFIYILFNFINVLLAVAKDPKKFINLPQKMKAVLTDAQAEQLRIVLNRSLFALKVLFQGLFLYSLYITIEVALGGASNLGTLWFFFMLAILALTGFMLWKSFRIAMSPKQR